MAMDNLCLQYFFIAHLCCSLQGKLDLGSRSLLERKLLISIFVCIYSQSFPGSKWCMSELDIAVGHRKEILPIYLDGSVPPDSVSANDLSRETSLRNGSVVHVSSDTSMVGRSATILEKVTIFCQRGKLRKKWRR